MSDTPRTDAERMTLWGGADTGWVGVVYAGVAEELERENAELRAAIKSYMTACPADSDTTPQFERATRRLDLLLAKAEAA